MTLKLDRWPWKSIGNFFYATLSFGHHFITHLCIQTVVTVWKCQIGAKFVLPSVTLTFDLWPWFFAWTSLLSTVITPENFMMIQWLDEKVWQIDGRPDRDRQDRSESCLVTAKNLCAYWSTTGMLIYLSKTSVHGNNSQESLSKYHLSCLNVRWSLTNSLRPGDRYMHQ